MSLIGAIDQLKQNTEIMKSQLLDDETDLTELYSAAEVTNREIRLLNDIMEKIVPENQSKFQQIGQILGQLVICFVLLSL